MNFSFATMNVLSEILRAKIKSWSWSWCGAHDVQRHGNMLRPCILLLISPQIYDYPACCSQLQVPCM